MRRWYFGRAGLLVLFVLFTCWATGCSSVVTENKSADFSLLATPSTASLTAGGSAQTITLSATAVDGFSGTVLVSLTGLPPGVTAAPASFSFPVGGTQQVSLTAAASAAAATATLVFTGTSGTRSHTASVALTVAAATTTPPPPPPPPTAGIDITTYHVDVARTGLNSNETTLTTSNVTSAQFGLLRTLATDGKVDAQALLLSGLTVAGQSHNVVYVVSEHDSVYAYDADTGTQLWRPRFLAAVKRPAGTTGAARLRPRSGLLRRR